MNQPITASRVARELIAANRARSKPLAPPANSPAQKANIERMNAHCRTQVAREKRKRAEKAVPANPTAARPETVEEWLAQGGKIEYLPRHASGVKLLRYDHATGNPLTPARRAAQRKQRIN